MRLKIWLSKDGWRVSLVWENGRIFATSEAYSTRKKAERAAWRVNDEMAGATYVTWGPVRP